MNFLDILVVALLIGVLLFAITHPIWATILFGGAGWLAWKLRKYFSRTITQGTATAFLFLGRYVYCAMEQAGHHFDADGFIIPGPGPNYSGQSWAIVRAVGLTLYVPGLVRPAKYDAYNDPNDGFGKGESITLHDQQRPITLAKAETTPGATGAEAVPLNIKAFFRMKVVCPELYLFRSPVTVVADVVTIMSTILEKWVRVHTPNEVLSAKANSRLLWDEIYAPGTESREAIERIRSEWGVEIMPYRLSIEDVDFPAADQEAQEVVWRQALQAKGLATRLMGAVLANVAARYRLAGPDEARTLLDSTADGKKFLDDLLSASNQIILQTELGEAYKRLDLTGLLGGGAGMENLVARGAALLGSLLTPPPAPTPAPAPIPAPVPPAPVPPAPAPAPVPKPARKPRKKKP